jgi:hypothetical protein
MTDLRVELHSRWITKRRLGSLIPGPSPGESTGGEGSQGHVVARTLRQDPDFHAPGAVMRAARGLGSHSGGQNSTCKVVGYK